MASLYRKTCPDACDALNLAVYGGGGDGGGGGGGRVSVCARSQHCDGGGG
jgi:hypothetical protein